MIQYRRLLAPDTNKLIELIKRFYGESYPLALFYDLVQLQEKISDNLLISAVAQAGNGEFIGHVGAIWEYEAAPTAGAVGGMIAKDYQRQGVLGQLTQTLGRSFQKPN